MKPKSHLVLVGMLALSLLGLASACQKGPAEKVGEKIDNAVQDTKDAARDMKHDMAKP